MLAEPKRIKLSPNSDVARLSEESKDAPLILESNGETSRLYHEETENLRSGYDAEKVKDAIADRAGSWADLDADRMIAELYEAREQGSRSSTWSPRSR